MRDPTDQPDGGRVTHESAAVASEFRIWVDGRLSEGFSNGLACVDQRDVGGGTVLRGAYIDEAHLQGVLDRLRGLGIKVMRFEVAEATNEEKP